MTDTKMSDIYIELAREWMGQLGAAADLSDEEYEQRLASKFRDGLKAKRETPDMSKSLRKFTEEVDKVLANVGWRFILGGSETTGTLPGDLRIEIADKIVALIESERDALIAAAYEATTKHAYFHYHLEKDEWECACGKSLGGYSILFKERRKLTSLDNEMSLVAVVHREHIRALTPADAIATFNAEIRKARLAGLKEVLSTLVWFKEFELPTNTEVCVDSEIVHVRERIATLESTAGKES